MEITGGTVTTLSIPERYVSDSQVARLDKHIGGQHREVETLAHAYLELDTGAAALVADALAEYLS